jgi:hypothetical protein
VATRYNAHLYSRSNYGVPPIGTGYGGIEASEEIPSCGLEDADFGLYKLFDKELILQVSTQSKNVRVPVIYASGEKWALLKRGAMLRDNNDSLILPLITIIRTGYSQDTNTDISGRGINQQTGEIIVKRKLDYTDRQYQNIINRAGIKNQKNVSDPNSLFLTTERTIGDLSETGLAEQGGLLVADKTKNVVETTVIPSPQFFTAKYEVTIWTQYTQHMNQIVEQILSSYLPQTQGWRIETDKGYWFMAHVDGNSWQMDQNADDQTGAERIIKQKFSLEIQGYIVASAAPGLPSGYKKYISCPEISFGLDIATAQEMNAIVDEPFLGADDPTLPLEIDNNRKRADLRKTGTEHIYVQNTETVKNPNDPAHGNAAFTKIKGPDGKIKYVRINSQGEVVLPANFDFSL